MTLRIARSLLTLLAVVGLLHPARAGEAQVPSAPADSPAADAAPEAAPSAPTIETGNSRRSGAFGELNEMAPEETGQFAFLIGDWQCTTRSLKPDRSGFLEGEGRWTGYYILDGWAIQDDWRSPAPGGMIFHGTNIRSFNVQTGKWDNRWLSAGNLRWKYYEAERQGDTMVMTGGEGEDPNGEFIDRNVFHDITESSWSWRKDRSYDGGETWFEGVAFIEAKRAGTEAPADETPSAD